MKIFFALAVSFAVAIGAALAQQDSAIFNPNGMARNFDVATMMPILSEIGLEVERRQTIDGQAFIAGNYAAGNVTFNIIPAACQNNGVSNCLGVTTLAIFTGENVNAQTVMAFNQRYHFTSAGKTSDGTGAYILRYDIADFGIPRGNIAASISNFLVMTGKFRDEITSGAATANQIGYADDLSAKFLNGRGLEDMSGEVQAISSRLESHQVGFEEIPELVKQMMADNSAARNKITNITPE